MAALPTWPRPNFTPGGDDALIRYAIFGKLDLSVPIDREKYRSAAVPDGLELVQYDRDRQQAGFHQYFSSRGWKLAAEESPAMAYTAETSPNMAVLRGFVKDPATLDYLRDCIGVIAYLFDRGAVTVFDPQTFHLWTADEWRSELFAPGHAAPHRHILILRSPEDHRIGNTEWIHTRGMRKFGRPDLSVRGVGPAYQLKVIELLNLYIDYQAHGGEILADDVVTLDGLPTEGTCYPNPQLDHPDFHNSHVEIMWPGNGLSG